MLERWGQSKMTKTDEENTYKLYTDGGSRGNGGLSNAACACILYKDDEVISIDGKFLGQCTNNIAEYEGLMIGVRLAIKVAGSNTKDSSLQIYMDSELVIKQLKGEYRILDERLKRYNENVKKMLDVFFKVSYIHVRREFNKLADRTVNIILDTAERK